MKQLLVALGTVVLTVVVAHMQAQQSSRPTSAVAAPVAQKMPASVAHASKVIDTYLKQHPHGRGTASLRRLSVAIKARPVENQFLAEAAANSVAHGVISKNGEAMLEEAAALAERGGLTPKEMAEFMKKWERDPSLSGKAFVAGKPDAVPSAPLPSFDGKLHVVYRFEGSVQCGRPSCASIPVSVHVSAGPWVEMRESMTDGHGHYALELPVITENQQKVLWQLEAHSNDLRHIELSGQRITTYHDRDVALQNNLSLLGQ